MLVGRALSLDFPRFVWRTGMSESPIVSCLVLVVCRLSSLTLLMPSFLLPVRRPRTCPISMTVVAMPPTALMLVVVFVPSRPSTLFLVICVLSMPPSWPLRRRLLPAMSPTMSVVRPPIFTLRTTW